MSKDPKLVVDNEAFSSSSDEESVPQLTKQGIRYGTLAEGGEDNNEVPRNRGISHKPKASIAGRPSEDVLQRSFHDAATDAVTLSWEDLRVILPPKKSLFRKPTGGLEILKGVSGCVQPGTLMAIMGASGSGKTTLLNVLTGRNTGSLEVHGAVRINGVNLQGMQGAISSVSAYVQQEDLFVGVLTVRQHLWFQAMLRMDQSTTVEQRMSRVNSVIRELGLKKCENSVIGTPNKVKSLSGGERKRLAFASEVLTNPALMFCDEPTSGLDSFMAENVVTTLKSLAGRGKTIVCTIHQPSSEIFALFDNLLLLAEGRIMYLGSATGARDFFTTVGYTCPSQYNPADFYIRTLAVAPGKETESRERLKKVGDAFSASSDGRKLAKEIEEARAAASTTVVSPGAIMDISHKSRFKASYLTQLRLVGWRSFLSSNKDMMIVGIRLMQNIVIALLSGLVFLGQTNDQKGVQNINGALFLMCTNMTFGNAFGVIMTFTSELALFKRDNENGTYRTSVYFICKSIADLPIFILNPIIFTTIMYWMIGFKDDFDAFLICTATSILLTNVVVAFGCMVSSMAGDPNIAMALAGPLLVPFSLFGGFLLNDASIPVYFIWLEYLSWFKYSNEIYFINQWHNFGTITCEYAPTNGTVPVGNGTIPSSRCFNNGEEVLKSFSYDPINLDRDFYCMLALFFGFRLIGYLALYLRANPIKFGRDKDKKAVPSQHPVV